MRRRVFLLEIRAVLAAFAILFAVSAFAQNTVSIHDPDEVADLLRQGQRLEQQRRWGEAMALYEEAARNHPKNLAVQQHYATARLHFDLDRRYADRSFNDLLTRMPADRSLALYGQVLHKIESHYVETPNWKKLVERGTKSFDMALGEASFVRRNVPERNRASIESFRRVLASLLDDRTITNRIEARDAVAVVAQEAQRRLEVAQTAVIMEYLCGATNSLDTYSAYLTPDQLNDVYSQIEGNFVGLGVELKGIEGHLVIVRVIAGSPAEEAGVQANDRILAVDRQSTASLTTDQAANLLQGIEGSMVTLTVAAAGQQPRQLTMRRRVVEVPSIDHVSIIDKQNGVGYFRLTCFQKTTARSLDAALWKLHREGMKSLIIDVRGNPGGLLVSAVEVVDRFVERGVIVSTRGRSSQEDFTYSAHEQGKWQMPLIVLVDQDSASAAEIFAGAIRDHQRGTIVGVKSFGKGSVQGIFPLEDSNAGLRLTTAKFYSPAGKAYSQVGVEPDIRVQQVGRPVLAKTGEQRPNPAATDATLTAALQTARRLGQTLQAARP